MNVFTFKGIGMKRGLMLLVMTILLSMLSKSSGALGETMGLQEFDMKQGKYVINDYKFYRAGNFPRPEKGVTFVDPVFHSKIRRITNSEGEAHGGKYDYAFPGYPKHDIENADGSLLVIQSFSGSTWNIWNANSPYTKVKEIPASIIGWGRPIDVRWDTINPDILYYSQGGKFWEYKISKDKPTALYDFGIDFMPRHGEQYPLCGQTLQEEGDGSDDRRYWAFNIYCFDPKHSPQWYSEGYVVYDKDYSGKNRGKIISKIKPGDRNFRAAGFVSMSPSGKYVWIGDTHFIYSRDFSTIREMGFCCHADMAVSAEGREVIFGFKDRPEKKEYWAIMADIETGEITYLSPVGSPRYHFSGNSYSAPGWGVVSTYYPQYPESEKNWGDHEVFMIELTKRTNPPPRLWRIAHTNTLFKNYADAPFAKINRKGTKIWFGSAWGHSYLDRKSNGVTPYPYDVYQIDLPQNWYKDLMGSTPAKLLPWQIQ